MAMKRLLLVAVLASPASAISIQTVAAITTVAANADTIVRSAVHPVVAWRKARKSVAAAIKGKPKPVDPVPVPSPTHDTDYKYPKGEK